MSVASVDVDCGTGLTDLQVLSLLPGGFPHYFFADNIGGGRLDNKKCDDLSGVPLYNPLVSPR